MSCEDIPSLLDLQNTKKHVDDLGRLMGTDEGDSTNGVTGQTRPTYNKLMKSVGFKPGPGDFTTGFVVLPGQYDTVWRNPTDDNWYSYIGIIPSTGYTVAPGTNPIGSSDWSPRTDQLLRHDLALPSGSSLSGFIQLGAGAIPRIAQDKMRERITPKDFGAIGDGVNDDTESIQKTLDYCRLTQAKFVGDKGTYKISATLNIVCNADMGEMTISCPAATVPIAVRIGTTSGSSSDGIIGLSIVAPKVNNSSKTTLGWSGFESSVGIELANLYASEVHILHVTKFGIGIRAGGYTQGCAYNNIFIGVLFDNKISLALQKQGPSGFSNQNTYYGGQYGKSGAEGSLIAGAYGIFLDKSTNNNTFINPSIETECDLYQVYLKGSSFNTFINHRFEVSDGGRVCLDASTVGEVDSNTFINGYSFAPPNFTYVGVGTSVNNKVIGQKYGDYVGYSQRGIAVNNHSGDGVTAPHLTGYSATINLLSKNPSSSPDYAYKICTDKLVGKRNTDLFPRMELDWNVGKIRLGDGTAALTNRGFSANSALNWVVLDSTASLSPLPDNTTSLGNSSYRWKDIFAVNGTINTSDAREKTIPLSINDDILDAWGDVKIITFQWLMSVQQKGVGAARWHFGVIAQQVRDAFSARGLDGTTCGLLCYDEWEKNDDIGLVAGNRWGIRSDQCLFLEAAYQRRRLDRIEKQLAELETK